MFLNSGIDRDVNMMQPQPPILYGSVVPKRLILNLMDELLSGM